MVTLAFIVFAAVGVIAYCHLRLQIDELWDVLIDLSDDGYRSERDIWPR